jgi:carbonic anhydrase
MGELTRREMLKVTGAAIAAYALRGPAAWLFGEPAIEAAPPDAWNHDPNSPIGPFQWADIGFPTCGQGLQQSPVNIETGQVAIRHGPPLRLEYHESELAIENTGHVVEVPIPAGVHNTLQIGDDRYELVQYHFHAPSEHAVNGRLADVEAHFVHQNAEGATVVVGVFYRLGRRPNPLLERVLLAAPMEAGDEVNAGEANPAVLFRDLEGVSGEHDRVRVGDFYTYSGSLTTPGCTENVRWTLLTNGGHVSQEALSRFHQVISLFPNYDGYPNNNRPVQPLNGRVIKLRRSGGDDDGDDD